MIGKIPSNDREEEKVKQKLHLLSTTSFRVPYLLKIIPSKLAKLKQMNSKAKGNK